MAALGRSVRALAALAAPARRRSRALLLSGSLLAAGSWSQPGNAQEESFEQGIAVGEWTFRPIVQVRVRGEYRRQPFTTGGDSYASTAPLAHERSGDAPPRAGRQPEASDGWMVGERSRLGLDVQWRALRAVVVLEDARVLGIVPGAPAELDAGGSGWFGPFEAYLGVRTGDVIDAAGEGAAARPWAQPEPTPDRPRELGARAPAERRVAHDWDLELRVGRQAVSWGDGRLLGRSDWSHRGASLDAARLFLEVGDFDVDALGALLAPPGSVPPEATAGAGAEAGRFGSGAQLYGLDVTWHALPELGAELTGLGRIVRDPAPSALTPSDVVVIDGRLFGEHRGFRYAAEGAYELGRVATYGGVRGLGAFAVAARASWLTALPGSFEFGLGGSYASGQKAGSTLDEPVGRFDPVLPEVHEGHGLMDAAAWSNTIQAGGFVGARPFDGGELELGFRFVGLAEPTDRWITGSLVPVGAAADNESRVVGYEPDLRFTIQPWDPVRFEAGYGLMVLGAGGRNALIAAGRGDHDTAHFAYLQAELRAP
jgi:hypothetical protein